MTIKDKNRRGKSTNLKGGKDSSQKETKGVKYVSE
jgi:hypothetical protein